MARHTTHKAKAPAHVAANCPAPDLESETLAHIDLPIAAVADAGKPTIVVDAGHGYIHGNSFDSGMTVGKHHESDITMAEAKAVAAELQSRGYNVVMTRDDSDEVLTHRKLSTAFDTRCHAMAHRVQMTARTALSANPTLFISLHVDSLPGTAMHGIDIYHQPGDTTSEELGAAVLAAVKDAKTAPARADAMDLFVLRSDATLNIPALLIETGFMTSKQDMKRLTSENGLTDIAKNIADGIGNFLRTKAAPSIVGTR